MNVNFKTVARKNTALVPEGYRKLQHGEEVKPGDLRPNQQNEWVAAMFTGFFIDDKFITPTYFYIRSLSARD